MSLFAYYFNHGDVHYIVLTQFKSLDIGGPTIYIKDRQEAISQAELLHAERVNF